MNTNKEKQELILKPLDAEQQRTAAEITHRAMHIIYDELTRGVPVLELKFVNAPFGITVDATTRNPSLQEVVTVIRQGLEIYSLTDEEKVKIEGVAQTLEAPGDDAGTKLITALSALEEVRDSMEQRANVANPINDPLPGAFVVQPKNEYAN